MRVGFKCATELSSVTFFLYGLLRKQNSCQIQKLCNVSALVMAVKFKQTTRLRAERVEFKQTTRLYAERVDLKQTIRLRAGRGKQKREKDSFQYAIIIKMAL